MAVQFGVDDFVNLAVADENSTSRLRQLTSGRAAVWLDQKSSREVDRSPDVCEPGAITRWCGRDARIVIGMYGRNPYMYNVVLQNVIMG